MEKISLIVSCCFCFLIFLFLFVVNCSGTRPTHVAEGHRKLAPCPETPNCVSSLATDDEHRMLPFTYETDTKTAMTVLQNTIRTMKRAEIIADKDNYLYVEFTSGFWRFVDDVEFSFDEENKLIHFRSASRLGRGDMGVNRKRMEEILRRFNESMKVLNK